MLVSQPEGSKTRHGQSSESTIESQSQIKFAQLSSNMKNYCGAHLQLLKKLEGGRLHGVIMLNPESQIKILESNLNFLNKENSRFKTLATKSSTCCSVNFPESTSKTQRAITRNEDSVKVNDFPGLAHYTLTGGDLITTMRRCQKSNVNHQSDLSNTLINSVSPIITTGDSKTSNNNRAHHSEFIASHNSDDNAHSEKSHSSADINKSKDGDNQYEFTLEQEKIVSFVCSPPRKQNASNCVDDCAKSDFETGVNSVKNLTSVDKDHRTSCQNSTATKAYLNDEYAWGRSSRGTTLLWHPPSIGKNVPSQQETDSTFSCCSISNRCLETRTTSNLFSFGTSINNTEIMFTNKRKFKNSFSQESILFREASLRGCYNIENIIRDFKPSQRHVEQNITDVRESIYSAIRTKKTNDDIVPDGVVAILDICKSWINLNAHFEREEFKKLLESYGINSSILSDFLHWQCVSRTFIDKMVDALKQITCSRNHVNASNQSFNTNNTVGLQGFNANKRYMNVPIIDGENAHFFREPGSYSSLSKTELTNNKHWKQRRFLLDQQKSATSEKLKKINKSKLTTSSCNINIPQCLASRNPLLSYGQGDGIPLYYYGDYGFGKNNSFLSTNNVMHSSPSKGSNIMPHSDFTESFKCEDFHKAETKGLDDMSVIQRDHNVHHMRPTNELLCCSTPTMMDMTSNHAIPIQTVPTISQYYNNPFCYFSPGQHQTTLNPALISQNPILCIDTDITDSCLKNCYMKPGNYNPPQKPTNCFRSSNNTVPIKEEQVTGFSFLYSPGPQSILQELKDITTSSTLQKHKCSDEQFLDKSNDSWRDALSLAKTVRDSLIATKIDSPNLNLSDTVSFKSHFLLSDEVSQHSSSNDFKVESESEDLKVHHTSTHSKDKLLVDSCLKTSDWLIKSFNDSTSESDQDLCKGSNTSDAMSNGVVDEESSKLNSDELTDHEKNYERSSSNVDFKNKLTNCTIEKKSDFPPNYKNNVDFTQRKPKKGKRIRNDCLTYFEHPATILHRKPKSIFKRTVTQHILCKLENMLNCIWKTDVSNLITEDLKSDQEKTRLELNVRSPLYLQAMKCKLSNHSYDTLEQALADFQQYFIDARNRNKGDKHSMEAIDSLEQLFFDLVEKNFGLPKQHSSQFLGPIGTPRRTKKTIRRC